MSTIVPDQVRRDRDSVTGRLIAGKDPQFLEDAAMADGRVVNVDKSGATKTQFRITVASRHLDYLIAQYALANYKQGDPEPGVFSTDDQAFDEDHNPLPRTTRWIPAAQVPDPDA